MIHLLNYQDKMGGGWTFSRNFIEVNGQTPYDLAEWVLVAGPTLATREDLDKCKKDGKKIALRLDNHLLDSRNRGTGMTRMKLFSKNADLVIYQSEWAKGYLQPFTGREGPVIINGCDLEQFVPSQEKNDYLYVRSSRINEKGWEMAKHWFSINGEGLLNIAGKFSADNLPNFDFFMGERFKFWGEQSHVTVATLMSTSKYFLYSYFMDACSNTLIEARAAGCEIIDVYGMLGTGGAPEIMACKDLSRERMVKQYLEVLNG